MHLGVNDSRRGMDGENSWRPFESIEDHLVSDLQFRVPLRREHFTSGKETDARSGDHRAGWFLHQRPPSKRTGPSRPASAMSWTVLVMAMVIFGWCTPSRPVIFVVFRPLPLVNGQDRDIETLGPFLNQISLCSIVPFPRRF